MQRLKAGVTATDARAGAVPLALRLRRSATARAESIVLVVIVVVVVFGHVLPEQAPLAVDLVSLVAGAGVIMQALGIVLVYRSSRVINFAQIPLGAVGGLLFAELAFHLSFIRLAGAACGCVGVSESTGPRGGVVITGVSPGAANVLYQLNYWLAGVVAFATVLLISWLTYWLIVRRFATATRLVLTVVTIGLSQVFLLLAGLVAFAWQQASPSTPLILRAPFPFDWHVLVAPAVFHTQDFLGVAFAAVGLVAVGLYLRVRRSGVALRGVSENPERAATLGVPVSRVTSRAWLIAGSLTAAAGLLAATVGVSTPDSSIQVLAISAAVVGGLSSLPLTALAAACLSVVQGAVVWAYHSSDLFNAFLLVIVAAVLLVQRRRSSRVDDALSTVWDGSRESRPIPAELRRVSAVRRGVGATAATLAAVLLGLPWLLSAGQVDTLTVTLTYAIVGLSLLILTGWAGQISLGQFAFAGVGGYLTAILHLPLPVAIVVGGFGGAAAAVLVGLPALRLRGLQLAVTTLALALAVQSVLLSPSYLGSRLGSVGRPQFAGIDFTDERSWFCLVLGCVVMAVAVTAGLRRSRTARALIASRDNEPLAQSFGINLTRARLQAFALSGFMAAAAGVLFAYTEGSVNAASFSTDVSLSLFLMVVIGGMGSIAGPLIGAAYLGALDLFAPPLWQQAATGFLAVALLMFAPGGLNQVAYALRDAFLRRVADRHSINVPSLFGDRGQGRGTAPLAPKTRRGGGTIFIPARYRMREQWALPKGGHDHGP